MEEHETILPPPPTTRIVLWAAANALAYRLTSAARGLIRRALRRARHALAAISSRPIGTRMVLAAGSGRGSLMMGPLVGDLRPTRREVIGDDRDTVVDVRRPSSR